MPRIQLEEVQMPFNMYGNDAWKEEIAARKAIRGNLMDLQQTLNSEKIKVKFVKEKRSDGLINYALDYPDGSWISVVFDPQRKFPKLEG